MKRLVFVALFLASSAVAQQQQHPNVEQGVAPNKMYQFGDVDSVNVFNGNVMIRLPIGQSYPVGPSFSYQLTLAYNSKLWDFEPYEVYNVVTQAYDSYTVAYPDRASNAGFGWNLSLGRLLPIGDPNGDGERLTYVDSTGNHHGFGISLHDELLAQWYDCTRSGARCDVTGLKRVLYSHDGSNLRLKEYTNGISEVDFPNGELHQFDTGGRLVYGSDAFGNTFSIVYALTADGLVNSWTLTDSHFRTQTMTYKVWDNGLKNYKRVPETVKLSSFSETNDPNAVATYSFDYGTINENVPRGCGNDQGIFPGPAAVPMLKSITLPDGSKYSFTYHMSSSTPCVPATCVMGGNCEQGTIASIQFPTGGTRKFEYRQYETRLPSCAGVFLSNTPGIRSRADFAVGATAPAATWTYEVSTNGADTYPKEPCVPSDPGVPPPGPGETESADQEMQVAVTSPSGRKSIHYFSVWPTNLAPPSIGGFVIENYGYPFTSFSNKKSGDRNLSIQEYEGGVLKRSSYLLYQGLEPPDIARVIGSRTVFHDDPQTAPANGPHYVDVASSDYDGYGHLRTAVTDSSFPGTSPRTVTTRYNPSSTANGRAAGSNSLLIGPSSAWILEKYDRVTTSQGTANSVGDSCFDSIGFLLGRRTYKEQGTVCPSLNDPCGQQSSLDVGTIVPTSSVNDVVTTFGKQSAGTVNLGFVTDESWFGGDRVALPGTYSNLCTTPSSPDYRINYTYASGALASAQYQGMIWKTTDRDIDQRTGLPWKSRDASGLETTFAFDSSARLTKVVPTGRAWTEYTYSNVSGSTPASFVAKQCPKGATTCANPLTDSRTWFDDFGRVVLSKARMPDSDATEQWSTVKMEYDALGRAIATSMPQYATAGSYDGGFAPAFKTSTTYDAFDRPLTIKAPDNKETKFAYLGTRSVERTVKVATSATAETDATSTELYDGFGRLASVTEPGSNSTTTYTYDIGGRLSGVSMTAGTMTEPRSFTYDRRGFLQQESHPELGTDGGRSVTYENYDARGHAGRKLVGSVPTGATASPFDLAYQYDSAERIFKVDQILNRQTGATQLLKQFNYATQNDAAVSPENRRAGKLETSIRYNYPASLTGQAVAPPPGKFVVSETLKYQHEAGLISSRDTKVEHENGTATALMQQFTQSYEYDDLSLMTSLTYPSCVPASACAGGSPIVTVAKTYPKGRLSAITGYAPSLKYHASGMLSELVHGQHGGVDVKDTSTADFGMPRPGSITFAGWDDCVPPSAVIDALNAVCASTSGHTASVTSGATSYLWEITSGNGNITDGSTSSSITYSAGASGTVALQVTVGTSCGSTIATKNVAVTQSPTAGITSGNQTINPSQSATIQVALSGTSPWRITWSDGFVQDGVTSSTNPATTSRTVTPAATTTYSVTAVADAACVGSPTGGSVTITVGTAPPAPTGLTATTVTGSTKQVTVRWNVEPAATSYQLERAANRNGPWSVINPSCQQSGGVMTCTDSFAQAIPTPIAHVYQVKAVANGLTSGPSNMDYATVADLLFTDEPLVAGSTRIYGRHVGELRGAIDAVRLAAGLNLKWSNYNPLTGPILALHFYDASKVNDLPNATDLRNVLDEAVLVIRGGRLSYMPPAPAPGGKIFAYQVQETREGVK